MAAGEGGGLAQNGAVGPGAREPSQPASPAPSINTRSVTGVLFAISHLPSYLTSKRECRTRT